MDLFIQYDIERLRCYANLPINRGKIQIEVSTSYIYLGYSEVNYFNYCICLQANKLAQVVEKAQKFYKGSKMPHRILIAESLLDERQQYFLQTSGYQFKGQQVLMQSPSNKVWPGAEGQTKLELVSASTLASFTRTYLLSFESERINMEPVVLNFSQLLQNKAIWLYQVVSREGPVGVAVLFRSGRHFLLAGGAILPSYRQQGFHTYALQQRLQQCHSFQARSVSAWAYEHSASHRNMHRLGMELQKSFRIYEQ